MELSTAKQKTKGFLSNTFNTLSGKNGRTAAVMGWFAVANVVAAFVPPAVSVMSAFNLAVAAFMAHQANLHAKAHQQNKPKI